MIKAAELGDAEAHNQLSLMYYTGYGVEKDGEKEMIKEVYTIWKRLLLVVIPALDVGLDTTRRKVAISREQ